MLRAGPEFSCASLLDFDYLPAARLGCGSYLRHPPLPMPAGNPAQWTTGVFMNQIQEFLRVARTIVAPRRCG